LLLVDGHNSHYTQAFLEYAVANQIHVICYLAHAAHFYQGLDVAVFGILKLYWTQEKQKWERTHRTPIDKTSFLEIYGAAHIRALTPETIKMAFRKTGVFPFDPSVVTAEMLAPILESSYRGHLPLKPSTPVKIITDLLHEMRQKRCQERAEREHDEQSDDSHSEVNVDAPLTQIAPPFVQTAAKGLESTTASFIITSSPVQSMSRLPTLDSFAISPVQIRNTILLDDIPTTCRERQLQAALQEANEREAYYKGCMVGLQANGILNGAYVDVVRSQLEAQEEKEEGSLGR
jgi:hypothetical protein